MDFVPFNAPDHPALNAFAFSINNQAKAAHIPPCALAAIVSVETGGRSIFQEGVAPGPGCGVGLCQITSGVDWTNLAEPTYHGGEQTWVLLDPSSNLYVAARYFLAPAIDECMALRSSHPTAMNAWNPEILFYAFGAYNAGFGTVRAAVLEGDNPDRFTTDDYAARAFAAYKSFLLSSHAAA